MPRLESFNLNTLTRPLFGKSFDWSKQERGRASGNVVAHFGDITTPLARFLAESESVVGCVAWITSPVLVDALIGKPVSLIVNKEWALRQSDTKPAAVRNRTNLARLTGGLHRRDFPAPLNQVPGDNDSIDSVRCVGHSPRARTANNPLMHHKFVVRLENGLPTAVWTGSFNFTVNAASSFENSLEIHDPLIAASFLAEYARVAALSEPLNFKAGAAAPDWGPRRAASPAPAGAKKTAARRSPVKAKVPAKPKTQSTRVKTAPPKRAAAKPRPPRKRPVSRPKKSR